MQSEWVEFISHLIITQFFFLDDQQSKVGEIEWSQKNER